MIGRQACIQKEAVVKCKQHRPWPLSEGTGINLETCNAVQTVLWPIVERESIPVWNVTAKLALFFRSCRLISIQLYTLLPSHRPYLFGYRRLLYIDIYSGFLSCYKIT